MIQIILLTILTISFILFILLIYIYTHVVSIPLGSVAVVENLGDFKRVITSGLHVLAPLETLKKIRWSYVTETASGAIRSYTRQDVIISINENRLDSIPVKCFSKDNIPLTVNGVLMYKITEVKDAVYKTVDLMAFLCDSIIQATRFACQSCTSSEITDKELTTLILREIQGKTKEKGIEVIEFMIQSITYTPDITKAREESYKRYQMEQGNQLAAEAKHTSTMLKYKHDEEEGRKEYEKRAAILSATIKMNQMELKGKLDNSRAEKDLQIEFKSMKNKANIECYKNLLAIGLTPTEICQMHNTKLLSDAIQGFKGANLFLDPSMIKTNIHLTDKTKESA